MQIAREGLGTAGGTLAKRTKRLGYDYALERRPTQAVQKERFSRFKIRHHILKRRAGGKAKAARVFHSGLLPGVLFGVENQELSPSAFVS